MKHTIFVLSITQSPSTVSPHVESNEVKWLFRRFDLHQDSDVVLTEHMVRTVVSSA
jgi:hypothetical protein